MPQLTLGGHPTSWGLWKPHAPAKNRIKSAIPGCHSKYEGYVGKWWSTSTNGAAIFEDIVKNNNNYYGYSDWSQGTMNLASYSHGYVDTIYTKVYNKGLNWDLARCCVSMQLPRISYKQRHNTPMDWPCMHGAGNINNIENFFYIFGEVTQ